MNNLAQQHWNAAQKKAGAAMLKTIADKGIETVRVVFADQHGVTRGKSLVASAMSSAFKNGVGMTSTLLLKDTSHQTVFPVWEDDAGFGDGVMTGGMDFLMLPDPTRFQVLPWAEKTGWVLCDIYQSNGAPIQFSTRQILRTALDRLADKGMQFVAGLEVEFTVLKVENPRLDHGASDRQPQPPATSLISHGYQHLTEANIDRLEGVMSALRRQAQELYMPVRSVEAEFGPSQIEFVFDPQPAMEAADTMILFRNMVKQTCTRMGLHATFMSRPAFRNAMGSGWHLHQSLVDKKTGKNLFEPNSGQPLSDTGSAWIAGILEHAAASCVLTTPTVNGYKRYQPHALAPDRIQWGRDNRGAMLRALCAPGDPASRIENRVGEPAANPYLYLASQILSGLDGLDRGLSAPEPVEKPYHSDAEMLPGDLGSALSRFETSDLYRAKLGDGFVDYLSHIKRAEWGRYLHAVSDWEQREYFSTF